MEHKTNWWMVATITFLALLFFNGFGMGGFGGFGCGSYRNDYGGMMSWMFGNPFGWVLGLVSMIILWALAIVILIYFIKMISGSMNQQKLSHGVKNGKSKNH